MEFTRYILSGAILLIKLKIPLKLKKNFSGLNQLKLILLQEAHLTNNYGQRDIVKIIILQILISHKELLVIVIHGLGKLTRELNILISEHLLILEKKRIIGIVLHAHLLILEKEEFPRPVVLWPQMI